MSVTIKHALQDAHHVLGEPRSGEILLGFILRQTRAYLYTYPDKIIPEDKHQRFQNLKTKRAQGVPIAYLLGEKEFYSLRFKVTPDTLIPRPETELLIDTVLEILPSEQAKVLDLGTGSGVIAITLAKLRPHLQVMATDFSAPALQVAKDNAKQYDLTNIEFLLSHWFDSIAPQAFDIIVSNPPYIADRDPHLKQGDVRFEPETALQSGAEGLDDLKQIIKLAPAYLVSGGSLLVEHGFDQADAVQALFKTAGFHKISTVKDLAGLARMTWANK